MRGTRKSLEQTSSENYLNVTKNTTPTIRVSHLLAAASVSALALALPGPVGIYGTRAWAQALPPGCEDETGDTTANDGEIIECEGDPTNGNLDPVSTDVDDLTLILGSETANIDLLAPGGSNENGVTMSGSGPQSLTIKNIGSAIYGQNDGVSVTVEAGGVAGLDNLTIVSEGQIEAPNTGINAANFGAGDTTITTSNLVSGKNTAGINVRSREGASVTITQTGSVSGHADNPYGAVQFASAVGNDYETNDGFTLDGSVEGHVQMQGGDDTFNFGGEIVAGSTVYGSEGTDTVNVTSTDAKTLDGSGDTDDSIQGFEALNLNSDNFTLAGAHLGWSSINFNSGTTFLSENAVFGANSGLIARHIHGGREFRSDGRWRAANRNRNQCS
jgi:hypothetical protein